MTAPSVLRSSIPFEHIRAGSTGENEVDDNDDPGDSTYARPAAANRKRENDKVVHRYAASLPSASAPGGIRERSVCYHKRAWLKRRTSGARRVRVVTSNVRPRDAGRPIEIAYMEKAFRSRSADLAGLEENPEDVADRVAQAIAAH